MLAERSRELTPSSSRWITDPILGQEQTFTTQLPDMGELGSRNVDVVLMCLPGMLLFVLLGSFIHQRRRLGTVFAVLAALTAWLLCSVFSRAFGNTWTEGEIVVLLVSNLHWWLLALVPTDVFSA